MRVLDERKNLQAIGSVPISSTAQKLKSRHRNF
jgi:hypothetical protein